MNGDQRVLEHLRMIQNVIDRMGRNSFQLKGWSAALATGWLVFVAGSVGKVIEPWWLALIPFVLLFALDGYFLWQERLFRDLYNDVRKKTDTDYSMKTREVGFWHRTFGWFLSSLPTRSQIIPTIILFHSCIILILIIVENPSA